ncbi:wound-responsive family protein [Striga hermonthica]|uniref:Wound-responsive family protein n=1 Tax=Striga hermonthica TaxID=68872 RepID=A0A9N7N9T5_STRHE|nr:wound-responsive family protein [Striga hermonthica]
MTDRFKSEKPKCYENRIGQKAEELVGPNRFPGQNPPLHLNPPATVSGSRGAPSRRNHHRFVETASQRGFLQQAQMDLAHQLRARRRKSIGRKLRIPHRCHRHLRWRLRSSWWKMKVEESQAQAGPNRLGNVIEKIERMHADNYFQVDNSSVKHGGFFVNPGKLERIKPATTAHQQPKKRRREDSTKVQSGNTDKVPVMPRKEGSNVRSRVTLLEKDIRELEKIVAESRPPLTEVQDLDNSSLTVKRRLPHGIKQKLDKVARLAQASYGKISMDVSHVTNRLMSIVGHLMQLRTLKRNLKIMANLGLSVC